MSLKQIGHNERENKMVIHTAKDVLRENWQLYMFIFKKCWKVMLTVKLKKLEKEKNDLYREKYKSLLGDMK